MRKKAYQEFVDALMHALPSFSFSFFESSTRRKQDETFQGVPHRYAAEP